MLRKKPLDYLLVPASSGNLRRKRERRAAIEISSRKVKEVMVLNGKDSEEDILYLGKIVKKGDRIGFDTFPLHYKEYRILINKAKREGKFPRVFKIENIKTGQGLKELVYGFLGLNEERLKHRKLDYRSGRHEEILQSVKNVVKRLIRLSK